MHQPAAFLWQMPPPNPLTDDVVRRHERLRERLHGINGSHRSVRFACSMAAEDLVLIDAIAEVGGAIEIFTLDTGRLHQETLNMIDVVQNHYGILIKRMQPDPSDVTGFVRAHGLNGFYEDEAAKKACCRARKVLPLERALLGAEAWVSGQRQEQSVTRTSIAFSEIDEARGLTKYNPLFDWSDNDVWTYLQWRAVPIHPLHRQGFPSIGCEPCTRAIRFGEETRAGRWWWLQQENKECGLHVK